MCILERFFIDFCMHLLISEICGRFPLLLEIYSPTDSTDFHRFYISQYPCSSVLSVGDSLCCLRFILPRIPQIFTDFIYPSIRAPLCYLWETPSHPISVFICAICGRFLRTTMGALIPSSTARCGLCADPLPLLSPQRAGVASPRRSGPSRSGRRVARYAPVRRDVHQRPRSSRTPLCW